MSGVTVTVVDRDPVDVSVQSTAVVVAVGSGPQGPAGPYGSAVVDLAYNAATILSGNRAVFYSPSLGGWTYADKDTHAHASAQIAVTTGAVLAGFQGYGRVLGPMDEPSWSWPAPCPIYLGNNGVLTATPPTTGFVLEIGRAVSPTRLVIHPEPPIILS